MLHFSKDQMSCLFCLLLLPPLMSAKVNQCHADCRKPSPFRLVGPTRPWHKEDELGNHLRLTKPYPFSTSGSAQDYLQYNLTFSVLVESVHETSIDGTHVDLDVEKQAFVDAVQETLKVQDRSFDMKILESSIGKQVNDNVTISKLDLIARVRVEAQDIGETEGDNNSVDDTDTLLANIISGENFVADRKYNATRSLIVAPSIEIKVFGVHQPNPYSKFCEYGCSLFYASPSDPLHVEECLEKCDDFYEYNVTVGYNDLAEVARLECRDGCQIGLMRCQPGYYCSQVRTNDDDNSPVFEEGIMTHCPAGTYRDVSYDAVEECVPCPPGRFREDIKGRNLDACTKCPSRTYNHKNGSSTIEDCLRCPAGTFTNEPGSAKCICITPSACKDEFPSPGDAEKRDTVPYIGRW